ncbi:MAG: alpha/beta hydrolase [Alphaproteobacteria bacterium]|nr:alpha/beta hydrolase [Alphaproteobacteria bacterium]
MILLTAACAPRLQPTGAMTGTAEIVDGAFIARDRARLPLTRWAPEAQEPRAVIVALHGFNDYSNAFAEAAETWAASGIVTYAIDQRGFGRSPHRRLWAGVDAMVHDARGLVDAARRRHPGLPVYLLGDSMGGAVAMVALARPPPLPVAGAVLVAPAVWGRRHLGALGRASLWLAAHTVPWLGLRPEGLEIRPSDNLAMLRRLAKDELIIKFTRVDALWGLVNLMDAAYGAADAIDTPLLLLYGANDEVIPKEPTREVLKTLLARGARAAYYAKGYHMLLRDLDGTAVAMDVAAWIENPSKPLPSGADAAAAAWLKPAR